MPATPVYQLPYPAAADPADVPTDMQELADQIEARIAPGTVSGQIPVWDQTNKRWVAGTVADAGRELGFAQFVSAVSVPTTANSEAAAVTVISAGAITFDGSAILIEFASPMVQNSGNANQATIITVWDGATSLGNIALVNNGTAPYALGMPVRAARRLAPSSGSHTFAVKAHQALGGGGSCTILAGPGTAGQYSPGFIRVTKV